MFKSNRIAVLFINLGSPNSPTAVDVKRYLAEFLSDKRVVDLSPWLWLPILHLFILNTRPIKSAKKYAKIWINGNDNGSPLIVISRRQINKLRADFAENIHHGTTSVLLDDLTTDSKNNDISFYLAMRYGEPSIAEALDSIAKDGISKVLILPAYPQYCSATTASIFDKIALELSDRKYIPELRFINNYYQEPLYIQAMANKISSFWRKYEKPEKIIFSYHGIPQSYVNAGDPYYIQCKETTDFIAKCLGLAEDDYLITFQSRFGKAKWLTPYTKETLIKLAKSGVKTIHIISPAFSADCLETLEELEEENREYFLQNGGQVYRYIPALNDDREHIELFRELVNKHTANW